MATIKKQLTLTFKQPNIAESYGPYASILEAHEALSEDQLNVIGMTVGIEDSITHTIEEYWYQGGTTEQHLVKKQSSEVEANPTGEATTPLNKIKIGETNYNIPQTDTSNFVTNQELQQELNGYVQKTDPPSPAAGDIVVFDEYGGFGTSKKTVNDFATAAQGAKADTAVQPSALNGYVQKSQTTGLLKNDGTVDTQTAGKAASALQPVSGATENNFASFDSNGGIKDSGFSDSSFIKGVKQNGTLITPVSGVVDVTVQDGEDGLSAFEIAQQQGFEGDVDDWLASLKANIGEFKFITPTDTTAEAQLTTIGSTYASTIGGVSPTQSTLSVILLMNDSNNTKTMMIATQDDGNSGYEFVYVGDLQSAMSSNVLTDDKIDNSFAGGIGKVAGANKVKELNEQVNGVYDFIDIDLNLYDNQGYNTYEQGKIAVNLSPLNNIKAVRIPCSYGDKFRIYGKGLQTDGAVFVLYTFSDGTAVEYNNKIYYTAIEKATPRIITRDSGLEIEAPEGSVYLSINFYDYDSTIDKIQKYTKIQGGFGDEVNNISEGMQLLDEKVEDLNKQANGVYNFVDVELNLLTDRGYLTVVQDKIKVDLSTISNVKAARISCNPGDKFRIYGMGYQGSDAVAYVLYTFSDDSIVEYNSTNYYTAIEKAVNGINKRDEGLMIEAPEGSKYLSINFYDYDSTKDKLQKYTKVQNGIVDEINNVSEGMQLLDESMQTLDDEIFGSEGYVNTELVVSSGYINTNFGEEHKVASHITSSTKYYCSQIAVTPGEKFKIYGEGYIGSLLLYAFADSSDNRLTYAEANVNYKINGHEFTAPENAVRLVINFKNYNGDNDRLEKWGKTTQGIEDRVTALEEQQTLKPFSDKVFVVFGDSLTEYKDTSNKGWCDYFAENTGATVINVAIGGSQIRQRRNLITLFDPTKTYNIGDWMYYKKSTIMNCYTCIQQHTGPWNDSDFSLSNQGFFVYSPLDIINMVKASCDIETSLEDRFTAQEAAAQCISDNFNDNNIAIIERLKAIDWSTVDGVILLGGGNDFNQSNGMGVTGSTNINTTLGALNEIVRLLLSTYKKISLYYISPTPRWFNYNDGVGQDSDWCDVYYSENTGMTFKAFVAALINEFTLNHIPAFDLYNTIGWNKYNFSQYFNNNDGVHPRKGFKYMGVRISAYLNSVGIV